jgi:UDP-galactopyranose mutase
MINVLIGYGVSGLGFADYFKNKLVIYEKNKNAGGHAKSHKIGNFYFDEGAHIGHAKSNFFKKKFYQKNNLIKIVNPNVISFYKGKKVGYPINISLNKLNFKTKLKIIFDYFFLIFKKNVIKNFKDWCEFNFGNTLYANFYKPYTLKYWRTNPSKIDYKNWANKRIVPRKIFKSILSIFLNIKNKEIAYNIFYYPKKGGFYSLFKKKFNRHKAKYKKKIEKINLNEKFILINKKKVFYDKLYSTIPLPEYLKLIKKIPLNIKNELNKLKYTSTICINFSVKKKTNINFHWCYFYDKEIDGSRMSILSNIVNDKSDYYYGQIEVFRRNDEKINVNLIKKNTIKFLTKFFKVNSEKDFKFISTEVYKYSYPVPLLGTNIQIIHSWLKLNNIIPFGLYGNWKYMWTDESYMNGKQNAEFYSK